jgi:purine-nucleoside/S-methyl-5'-thioadenosine phosphorylase / adenosine deaminase
MSDLAHSALWVDLGAHRVRALITTRAGGASTGPWAAANGGGGLNLGLHSGDAPETVLANRARLGALVPQSPRWLRQVHGSAVVDAESIDTPAEADASTSVTPGVVCAVLIADCMPVLLASRDGRGVAAAHAGWRGIAAGVIQGTVRALRQRLADPGAALTAYLGPAIGPAHFEVGAEVLDAMRVKLPHAEDAFVRAGGAGKYRADLFQLGRMALAQVGVSTILGGTDCTFGDPARFYSFRRDRVTGRHAALVWIKSEAQSAGAGLTPDVG